MNKQQIAVCLKQGDFDSAILQRALQKAASFQADLIIFLVPDLWDRFLSFQDPEIQSILQEADDLAVDIETVGQRKILARLSKLSADHELLAIYLDEKLSSRQDSFNLKSFPQKIHERMPNVPVATFLTDRTASFYKKERSFGLFDLIAVSFVILMMTFLGLFLETLGVGEIAITTLYLLGVLICSLGTGSWQSSLLAFILSLVLYNYFFATPKYSVLAEHADYPIFLLALICTTLISARLSTRLNTQNKQFQSLSNQQSVLLETNQALQKAENAREIGKITLNQLFLLAGWEGIVFMKKEDGTFFRLRIKRPKSKLPSLLSKNDRKIVESVWDSRKPAGKNTTSFEDSSFHFIPIQSPTEIYGVIALYPGGEFFDQEKMNLIEALLNESALALESLENRKRIAEAVISLRTEKTKSNLLRAISHDLRTPITSILGNASNLYNNEESFNPPTRKQIYKDMMENSNWLFFLVENLLSASKMEHEEIEIRPSIDLVDDLVEEAVHIAKSNHPGVKIDIIPDEEFLMARLDAKLILQVMHNLIENAIVHTPENTPIAIRTSSRDGQVIITVLDRGPGIAPKDIDHIFEMFYTGKVKADSSRSMGLGLYLCQKIVQAHRGKIWYEPNEPNGSAFSIALPQAQLE